jgi:DnaJ-class molecular chaperone
MSETGAHSFRKCEACGGAGFLRLGAVTDNQFVRCKGCAGTGQLYLNPVEKPPPETVAA